MDETRGACRTGGGQEVRSASHIAGFETGLIRRVDNPRDVDDGVRAFAKPFEAGDILQRTGDPFDVFSLALLAASEGADLMARLNGLVEQARADKACGAGYSELQRGDQGLVSAGSTFSSSDGASR